MRQNNPLLDEEIARSYGPATVFGPPRAHELVELPWDWRREAVKGLLFAVEGFWVLIWALYLLRLTGGGESFERGGLLVAGWFALAALALGSGHILMGWEERVGWVRGRLLLAALIAVSTLAWWLGVSGGLRSFFSEIGGILRLRPGVGFWTLWLGLFAWWRGLDWSQQVIGLRRARLTLHAGLAALIPLALLSWRVGGVPPLLPPLIGLWTLGIIALGLTRLVSEDSVLSLTRSIRLVLKQTLLVAGAAIILLTVGSLVLWVILPEQRSAISGALIEAGREPSRQVGLVLLQGLLLVVALVWQIVYWIVTQLTLRFDWELTPFPAPAAASGTSLDYIFDWLSQIFSPQVLFAVRLVLFTLFGLWMLLLLITRLDRVRYAESRRAAEVEDETESQGLLRGLLAQARSFRLPARAPAPEPRDAVRRVYVRLVRLGNERGAPWAGRRTPYEHEAQLDRVLPGHEEEIHLITEQYVRVRYADETLAVRDVRAVEEAWARLVRDVGAKP